MEWRADGQRIARLAVGWLVLLAGVESQQSVIERVSAAGEMGRRRVRAADKHRTADVTILEGDCFSTELLHTC